MWAQCRAPQQTPGFPGLLTICHRADVSYSGGPGSPSPQRPVSFPTHLLTKAMVAVTFAVTSEEGVETPFLPPQPVPGERSPWNTQLFDQGLRHGLPLSVSSSVTKPNDLGLSLKAHTMEEERCPLTSTSVPRPSCSPIKGTQLPGAPLSRWLAPSQS